MIEERELWACASHYLRRHGAEARSVVALRIADLRAGGELEGARVFARILDRIEQLEARAPGGLVQ
jgi:hypothetical protein